MLVLANQYSQSEFQLERNSTLSEGILPDSRVIEASDSLDDQPMSHSPDFAEFCLACGKSEPVRFTVSRRDDPQAHFISLIERPFAIVGRGETCDVRLDHPDVSRRHAYLQMIGGRMYCCDLGSRTGTAVAGHGFTRGWVGPEQIVQIGPYHLQLSSNEFRDETSLGSGAFDRVMDSDDFALTHESAYLLNCINARSNSRGGPKIRRLRDRITLVGSHDTCNLRLHHASVSRAHCSIVLTHRGVWVVDLSLKHKTLVNGVPIVFSKLREGDELHLGDFRLVVDREPVRSPVHGGLPARIGSSVVQSSNDAREISVAPPAQLQTTGSTSDQSQLLLTIVNQFTAAQRDLFENTRQMMATMAETFNTAHQRQMDLIREELVRVHDLNRELQQLQRELLLRQQRKPGEFDDYASNGRPPDGPKSPLKDPAGAIWPSISLRVTNNGASTEENDSISTSPPIRSIETVAPTAAANSVADESFLTGNGILPEPTAAPMGRDLATESTDRRGQSTEDSPSNESDATVPAGPDNSPCTSAPSNSQDLNSGVSAVDEHDLHGWLNDRISKLEAERTGRWQRIMQILSRSG